MSDVVDRANELVQQRLDDELNRRRCDAEKPRITHSYCVDCEQKIPVKRLEKIPTALRCVECQTIFEQQEAVRAGYR